MSWFDRLLQIDRRWIFLAIAVAVTVPFFLPLGLPIVVTPPVESLYDAVDSLEPNSNPLLLAIDYAPATLPELEPMAVAILRQAFEKNINVIVLTLHPAGYGLAERALLQVAEEYDKVYAIATILRYLKKADDEEQKIVNYFSRKAPQVASRPVSDKVWETMLAHPGVKVPFTRIFSLLYRLDAETGGVFPDLATSWEWEDDTEPHARER